MPATVEGCCHTHKKEKQDSKQLLRWWPKVFVCFVFLLLDVSKHTRLHLLCVRRPRRSKTIHRRTPSILSTNTNMVVIIKKRRYLLPVVVTLILALCQRPTLVVAGGDEEDEEEREQFVFIRGSQAPPSQSKRQNQAWSTWDYCMLDQQPIVVLSKNVKTGEFEVVKRFNWIEDPMTQNMDDIFEDLQLPPTLPGGDELDINADFSPDNNDHQDDGGGRRSLASRARARRRGTTRYLTQNDILRRTKYDDLSRLSSSSSSLYSSSSFPGLQVVTSGGRRRRGLQILQGDGGESTTNTTHDDDILLHDGNNNLDSDSNGSGLLTNDLDSDGSEASTTLTTNGDDTYHEEDEEFEYYYARECDCHSPPYPVVYCPLSVQTCNAPVLPSSTGGSKNPLEYEFLPGCITPPKRLQGSRNLLLTTIVWFAFLLIFMVFTHFGKNLFNYMISLFVPTWNDHVSRRMMQYDRHRANSYIRSYVFRRRLLIQQRLAAELAEQIAGHSNSTTNGDMPNGNSDNENNADDENDPFRVPTSLALRTKIYKAPPPANDDIELPTTSTKLSSSSSCPPTSTSGVNPTRKKKIFKASETMETIYTSSSEDECCCSKSTDSYGNENDGSSMPNTSSSSKQDPPSQLLQQQEPNMSLSITSEEGEEDIKDIHDSSSSDIFDYDSPGCAICFVALEDGDRIGALSCNHTFHVDCLKVWLPKRNVCPLCQARNIASPRYDKVTHSSRVVGLYLLCVVSLSWISNSNLLAAAMKADTGTHRNLKKLNEFQGNGFLWQASLDATSGRASSVEVSSCNLHDPSASWERRLQQHTYDLVESWPTLLAKGSTTLGMIRTSPHDPDKHSTTIRLRLLNLPLLSFGKVRQANVTYGVKKFPYELHVPITGGLLSLLIPSAKDRGWLKFVVETDTLAATTTRSKSVRCRLRTEIAGHYSPRIAGRPPISKLRKWMYLSSQSYVHAYSMWRFHRLWREGVKSL